eukprot:608525-Hanusia_phi.AAC.1
MAILRNLRHFSSEQLLVRLLPLPFSHDYDDDDDDDGDGDGDGDGDDDDGDGNDDDDDDDGIMKAWTHSLRRSNPVKNRHPSPELSLASVGSFAYLEKLKVLSSDYLLPPFLLLPLDFPPPFLSPNAAPCL